MAAFTGINLSGDTTEDIVDAITALNRTLEFQMTNLDDENIRELDYSKIAGAKPASDADNTANRLTLDGTNFTLVNGAFVYSGPADYNQINGGPPADADNTASQLPSTLGINFTKIGSSYIYTGTLSANQINAGTLNANYINGGTINGITVQTGTPGGLRTVMDSSSNLFTAYSNDTQYVQMNARYYGESLPTLSWVNGAHRADMFHLGIDGVMLKSSNNIRISPGGFYGTTYFTGIVDFAGATVLGLSTTAKFG